MGYNSQAGTHSTSECCYHNITAAPLRPFWNFTGPAISASSCFGILMNLTLVQCRTDCKIGHTGLRCYEGTKARYAPSSVSVWCFDENSTPVCSVADTAPYTALWLVNSLNLSTWHPCRRALNSILFYNFKNFFFHLTQPPLRATESVMVCLPSGRIWPV